MAILNFDANSVAPSAPLDALPAGTYECCIVESGMFPTKSGNGSFLKLRTIQFGYNFADSLAKKLYMQRIRMYVSAQNLFCIKSNNYSGVDPEVPTFGYPIPLNVTFGINVSF